MLFEGGASQSTLTVSTDDDVVLEADSRVTVTLQAGNDYELGSAASASVLIADNDEASFSVAVEPADFAEGQSAAVLVSVDNGVTFAEAQVVELEVGLDVTESDYKLDPASLTLAEGSTSVSATLTAVNDGVEEPSETATVTVRVDGKAVASAGVKIWDVLPKPRVVGVPQVGMTLETSFEETPPWELTYQWLREGVEIAGARGSSYVLTTEGLVGVAPAPQPLAEVRRYTDGSSRWGHSGPRDCPWVRTRSRLR